MRSYSVVICLALCSFTTSQVVPARAVPAQQESSIRPNILLIVTDDQRARTMKVLPAVRRLFGRGGTKYPLAFTPIPMCCPARATLFSGRYAHNHHVRTNDHARRLDQGTTFQRYLDDAGYHTALVGKYLNSWPVWKDPPHFDRFAFFSQGLARGSDGYHNVRFNIDGDRQRAPSYSTRFIASTASSLLEDFESDDSAPWLMVVTPFAPHGPAIPEDRYRHARVGGWRGNPAVREHDLSDKPRFVRRVASDPEANLSFQEARKFRSSQLRALMSVDDLVARTFRKLRGFDEVRDTLAIFTSDNGLYWGEHGLSLKSLPYLQALHVPLYVRWPGHVDRGAIDRRLSGLHDLAPTILEAAGLGAQVDPPMDGRSLFFPSVREYMLIEAWKEPLRDLPPWAALLSPEGYQYVEYYNEWGREVFKEYYDLELDPWQLENLAHPNDPGQRTMEALLVGARACDGPSCL